MFLVMCIMQELYLHYNQIGDTGVEALAKAGGAMAQLTVSSHSLLPYPLALKLGM